MWPLSLHGVLAALVAGVLCTDGWVADDAYDGDHGVRARKRSRPRLRTPGSGLVSRRRTPRRRKRMRFTCAGTDSQDGTPVVVNGDHGT